PAALLSDLAENLAERPIHLLIRFGIRGVKNERVYPSIGQQLCVSPEDPGIHASIISVKWFAPIMARADSAPQRGAWLLQRIRVRRLYLCNIKWARLG